MFLHTGIIIVECNGLKTSENWSLSSYQWKAGNAPGWPQLSFLCFLSAGRRADCALFAFVLPSRYVLAHLRRVLQQTGVTVLITVLFGRNICHCNPDFGGCLWH